jgi:hypothetical protein
MKKLLLFTFLILGLQTYTIADDIKDFQIEGISIGDSALNFFSEEEIKKNIRKNSYPNSDKKFYDANFNNFNFFKTYKNIQANFKKNDRKYIIQAISGGFFYDNMEQCLSKQIEIDKDLKIMFPNAKRIENKKLFHPADKTNNSFYKPITFYLKTGVVDLVCYDWNSDLQKSKYILISIDTNEFHEWLTKANN